MIELVMWFILGLCISYLALSNYYRLELKKLDWRLDMLRSEYVRMKNLYDNK